MKKAKKIRAKKRVPMSEMEFRAFSPLFYVMNYKEYLKEHKKGVLS